MTVIIKLVTVLGLILGIYGYINYKTTREGQGIYCQMTYLWVEHQDEVQSQRPGWPSFDPSIECNNGRAI